MNRPLSSVVLLYVAGILMARAIDLPLWGLFTIAFAICLVCVFRFPGLPAHFVVLWILAGWINHEVRTAVLSPHDLRLLLSGEPCLATVLGEIGSTPVVRKRNRNGREIVRTTAIVKVSHLIRTNAIERAFGRVVVSTAGELGEPWFRGQRVQVFGVIRSPPGAMADGLFDYQAYLAAHGVYHQLRVDSTNDWALQKTALDTAQRKHSDRFLAWARQTLARGLPRQDEPFELLCAMALGWKTGLDETISEPFMQSGTLHVFAISGLHVALISGILVSLLRVLQLPRSICGWIVIPVLWFYAAATGWQASAVRSTIMMSVVIAGWALRRPSDLLNSLASASLIILIWDPRQLMQASFQLSFFVVLSIALFVPPLERWSARMMAPDPLLPEGLRPWWKRGWKRPIHAFTTSVATSTAAWLGSLPLIAYYFHLVTPVSLLANIIIVPLSGIALMSCLGSLVCGNWLTPLTELFNHSSWFWMVLMMRASTWSVELPGAYFYVQAPSTLEFVVYYTFLIGWLSGWMDRVWRTKWFLAGVGVGAAGWLWFRDPDVQHRIRLTIPPLGGSAIFVDAPGRENDLLIDPGSESAVDFFVKPFLRAQGRNNVPQLLLTHGDVQHVGGFEALVNQLTVGQVLTSSIRFRSPVYRRAIAKLAKAPQSWTQINRGDHVPPWQVLHPAAGERPRLADDGAVVLWANLHGTRILLLSDLGKDGQRQLISREPGLRADLLVTGIPNGGDPLQPWFLETVQPQLIIVASAEYPASSQVTRPLREWLATVDLPVLILTETGTATVEVVPGRWKVMTVNGPEYAGEPEQIP